MDVLFIICVILIMLTASYYSNKEETTSRKEILDLKEPRFVDNSVTEINAEYIRGKLYCVI